MKIVFHGAAQEVTGSCYQLITNSGSQFLVDCGMFQGSQELEKINYEEFNFNPKNLQAVFLTHSHLDHSGLLPKLYRQGFRGKIFSTRPTRDICKLLFEDAANLILDKYFKTGERPIYELEDAINCVELFETCDYGKTNEFNSLKFKFNDAGHILGSSIIELFIENKKIVFSGDLGNHPSPIVKAPDIIKDANYVFIESTYGGITHEDKEVRLRKFKQAVFNVFNKESTLLIPSFALERTQEIMFELNNMVETGEIVPLPVFVDSPLANRITSVFKNYENLYDKETMTIIKSGDDIFNFQGLVTTNTVDESKRINSVKGPKIVIAGSGMCNGGRITKHLKQYIEDPRNFLVFVGYQAEGTLGREIFEGSKKVIIEEKEFDVNIAVDAIGGYSAHADQPQIISWLSNFDKSKLEKIIVVHGEKEKGIALSNEIKKQFGFETFQPTIGDELNIN